MKHYLMKCGHVANATQGGKPVCVICIGIVDGATEIVREVQGTDGLEGRKSRCGHCGSETPSSWDLPFFEYCPNRATDSHYDGCFGWD